jgi:hypothetical protein
MKQIRLVSIALLCAFVVPPSAHATAATVVYPTGQFPADVQNVQAALDQGGTVLLKATNAAGVATAFNFGPPVFGTGFVDFHRDAELLGERTRSAATTIQGGEFPVGGLGSHDAAVRDIDFQSPLQGAILFLSGANVEVTGNRIFHVVGQFFRRATFGDAILVNGGRVVISDNVVESVDADRGNGISEFGSTGRVEISRNRVSGTSVAAIESSVNGGPVRIEENVLRPGPAPTGGSGVGIEVNGTGAYTILRNDVVVETSRGDGIAAVGSLLLGFGPVLNPVIAWNRVVLERPRTIVGTFFSQGISLVGRVSGAYVGQNTIEGDGVVALAAGGLLIDEPSDLGFNTFVGNNIAGFRAGLADVFLDVPSHDTVLVGSSGSVIDLGTNNRITGFTDVATGSTGAQVSEAVRLRNTAAEAAREASFNRFEARP